MPLHNHRLSGFLAWEADWAPGRAWPDLPAETVTTFALLAGCAFPVASPGRHSAANFIFAITASNIRLITHSAPRRICNQSLPGFVSAGPGIICARRLFRLIVAIAGRFYSLFRYAIQPFQLSSAAHHYSGSGYADIGRNTFQAMPVSLRFRAQAATITINRIMLSLPPFNTGHNTGRQPTPAASASHGPGTIIGQAGKSLLVFALAPGTFPRLPAAISVQAFARPPFAKLLSLLIRWSSAVCWPRRRACSGRIASLAGIFRFHFRDFISIAGRAPGAAPGIASARFPAFSLPAIYRSAAGQAARQFSIIPPPLLIPRSFAIAPLLSRLRRFSLHFPMPFQASIASHLARPFPAILLFPPPARLVCCQLRL